MMEVQEEIDHFPARFGRDITGGQLAATAEYALNVFNLQHRQKLELQRLKHQVGQLQAANTALTEQMEVVQDQNVDLQNTVAELDNQLQQMLLNDGITMRLEANAREGDAEAMEIRGEP